MYSVQTRRDTSSGESSRSSSPNSNMINSVKLSSCLEAVREIIGDIIPESTLTDIIWENKFDVQKSLDFALNYATDNAAGMNSLTSPMKEISLENDDWNWESDEDNSRKGSSSKPDHNNVIIEKLFAKERGKIKPNLYVVVIGHVDAGKSTVMGHLLHKLGLIPQKLMHKYEQESKKLGKQSFLYAWLLDATDEERDRGITMDVGHSNIEVTTKNVIFLDTPGHKDYIPKMITGASQADAALLVVDATMSAFETSFESGGQTREHAFLVRSLGITQLGIVVNKMDNVEWSKSRFEDIKKKMERELKKLGFKEHDLSIIPCSGLIGENLTTSPTNPLFKWYKGYTLLKLFGHFLAPCRDIYKPFRMSVNEIYKGAASGFCVGGCVISGMIRTGDKVLVQPHDENGLVKALNINDSTESVVFAGDFVSMTIANYDVQNIAVGNLLSDITNPCHLTSKFEAKIMCFNLPTSLMTGASVTLHTYSLVESATIVKFISQLHKQTGKVIKKNPRVFSKYDIGVVEIETTKPIPLETSDYIKDLSRFVIRMDGVTLATGSVTKIY